MRIFIIASFLLGFVAMSTTKATEYQANDGSHPPGTFTQKTQKIDTRKADIMGTQVAHPTVPSTEVDPEKINTSPNPAPEKGNDNSSYGEAISSDKPYKGMKQAEEEAPKRRSKK